MHYLMPTKHEVLSLHSSANEGVLDGKKNVSVFFGLSGTGKTTLSADPHRSLIGDDEHVWTDDGIFNIEAFLVRHPTVYAEMLKSKMQEHSANAWLINTGWTGGKFGSKDGKRIPLRYTRAIIDAIHSG